MRPIAVTQRVKEYMVQHCDESEQTLLDEFLARIEPFALEADVRLAALIPVIGEWFTYSEKERISELLAGMLDQLEVPRVVR